MIVDHSDGQEILNYRGTITDIDNNSAAIMIDISNDIYAMSLFNMNVSSTKIEILNKTQSKENTDGHILIINPVQSIPDRNSKLSAITPYVTAKPNEEAILQVKVVKVQTGEPVANKSITWLKTCPSCQIPSTSTTDENGEATIKISGDVIGQYAIKARLTGFSNEVIISFDITESGFTRY